jgi:hypothetical protein
MLARTISCSDRLFQSEATRARTALDKRDESLDAIRGMANGLFLSVVVVWPLIGATIYLLARSH